MLEAISKSSAWSHGNNGDARERGTEDKIIIRRNGQVPSKEGRKAKGIINHDEQGRRKMEKLSKRAKKSQRKRGSTAQPPGVPEEASCQSRRLFPASKQ